MTRNFMVVVVVGSAVLGGCATDLSKLADEVGAAIDDDSDGKDGPRHDDADADTGADPGRPGGADEDPSADDCGLGVDAYCACADYYGYSCGQAEASDYLQMCEDGEDYGIFECMASFVDDSYTIDCYAAATACLY